MKQMSLSPSSCSQRGRSSQRMRLVGVVQRSPSRSWGSLWSRCHSRLFSWWRPSPEYLPSASCSTGGRALLLARDPRRPLVGIRRARRRRLRLDEDAVHTRGFRGSVRVLRPCRAPCAERDRVPDRPWPRASAAAAVQPHREARAALRARGRLLAVSPKSDTARDVGCAVRPGARSLGCAPTTPLRCGQSCSCCP